MSPAAHSRPSARDAIGFPHDSRVPLPFIYQQRKPNNRFN
jgi:hypothetical protein